ncbi:MAG: DUF4124 domain-containing protein [Pseudomonadota bacterium]
MKRVFAIVLLSSLCAAPALAETYVRVEKDGSKTYSDRPLAGGQPVELQPAQTYSAPPVDAAANSNLPREQQLLKEMSDFRYASCVLTPKNDETFTNPQSVSVGVVLQPNLRPGDTVDLRVDGTSVPGPSTLSFALPQPYRGAHTVSVLIKDRYGKTLCNASATFHVFRPSMNSPARR